ncbi:integrase [Labrenzia sp. EL_126]|nr:integrase [Labrenzia sp. EL_126]
MTKIPFCKLDKGRYHLRLDVPKRLQDHYGTKRIVKSLKTSSPSVARRRVAPLVAHYKAEFETLSSDDHIGRDAAVIKGILEATSSAAERDTLESVIIDGLEARVARGQVSEQDAVKAFKLATGQTQDIKSFMEKYIASRSLTPNNEASYRRSIERICEIRREVDHWTVPACQEYVDLLCEQHPHSTVRYYLSPLKGLWEYMAQRGAFDPDKAVPWTKVRLPRNDVNKKAELLPFTEAEVSAILRGIPEKYRKVITFMALTGCRVNEALKVTSEDVDVIDGVPWYSIGSKTEAGWRSVPVLWDEGLKPPLVAGAYNTNHTAVGKAIRKIIKGDHIQPNHSFRKRAVTLALDAGHPVVEVSRFVGHKVVRNVTLDIYGKTSVNRPARLAIAKTLSVALSGAI